MTQQDIENVRQNDLSNRNAAVKTNDKFGYDYSINMFNAKLWVQNEWTWNEVDLYYGLQVALSQFDRTTRMLNGRAWYLSTINPSHAYYYLGTQYKQIQNGEYDKSYKGYSHFFVDPSFKLGVTYKIDGHNKLKFNALMQTVAPLARDAYVAPRVHDRATDIIYRHDRAKNLSDYYAASEKRISYDLTYEFNYPIIRGRITAFQSHFWDGSELNGYYDDEARTFVNQAITNIDKVHRGIEAAVAIKLGSMFTLTPFVAVGDYHYTSNALAVTSAENGMALTKTAQGSVFELTDSVMIRGLKVASGPQVNASIKLSFFHSKMWFADITLSYFDHNYLDYAPARRMMGLYTGVRADGTAVNGWYGDSYCDAIQKDDDGNVVTDKYGTPLLKGDYAILDRQESLSDRKIWNRFMMDASVGKLIYLPNRQSLSINLSVTNLTNNTHFKTGGYQQARLPRQTRQGVADTENSVISPNVWKFPAKYYYAWGANFFLNITYKF